VRDINRQSLPEADCQIADPDFWVPGPRQRVENTRACTMPFEIVHPFLNASFSRYT